MPEKVSDIIDRSLVSFGEIADWSAKIEARKNQLDVQALEYLHRKFPGVEDTVFFTNEWQERCEHVVDAEDICDAAHIDAACEHCAKGECLLSDKFKGRQSRPVALVCEDSGVKYLCVRWTRGIKCHNASVNGEFKRLYAKSGLTEYQSHMTFKNYDASTCGKDAWLSAMNAAQEQTCLVLAGKSGTGKTHLAVSIAIAAMKSGRGAMFRLVSELIDELREANCEAGARYYDLMRQYKEIPCIVLDDMGKERTTTAGLDYVYQIVNYRDRYGLQTIITTNANSPEELCCWGNPEYILPIVSRMLGRGAWVTIKDASDYRLRRGGV